MLNIELQTTEPDRAPELWDKFLHHNPKNPKWFNRDRFVLSAGHGCMLLYALLHLTGYDSTKRSLLNHLGFLGL